MSQPTHQLPRILEIDIETAPHTGYVWGLFKQTIHLDQLKETGRTLCFSWKWRGDKGISYISELDGRDKMILKAHELLDEADIVVTYNGKKFDVPTLNKEFIESGIGPPSPYKHVDLYRVAKGQFRFASNKMDHLAKQLGIAVKIRHGGFKLWVQCMEGDPKGWAKMARYNKRDVLILDKLYAKMLPWIKGHPNVTIYSDTSTHTRKQHRCPSCGSHKTQSRGFYVCKTLSYRRYRCTPCGSWSRETISVPSLRPELVQVV